MSTGSEVTTNLASARFVVIDAPRVEPGSCGCCGKSQHEGGFVTTGLDFEFFGTLIFCSECALAIAAPVGGLTPTQYDSLVKENVELAQQVVRLQEQLNSLQPIKELVDGYNRSLADDREPEPNLSGDDSLRSIVDPEESDDTVNANNQTTEPTDSNFTELSSESGPNDGSDVSSDPNSILAELGIG